MINVIGPVLVLCAVAGVFSLRSRLLESAASDPEAIDDLMKSRQWRLIEATRDDNYWRYWLRGNGISNCMRVYVVLGERPGGELREVHVAFDPWNTPARRGIQVLLEREAARPGHARIAGKPVRDDDLL